MGELDANCKETLAHLGETGADVDGLVVLDGERRRGRRLRRRAVDLQHGRPVRVVLDSGLRTPSESKLMAATEVPTWIITEAAAASRPLPAGVELLSVTDCRDLGNVLGLLAERGITRLMVEGGHQIHTSFLASRFVDEIAWFRSATAIGGDGLPVFGPLGVETPGQALRFRRTAFEELGDDTLELFRPAV
ncbi:MAG: RibD family protein [Planctomycetes bacterium]|nr:RibD family protein [Planctomycetota bacterium]